MRNQYDWSHIPYEIKLAYAIKVKNFVARIGFPMPELRTADHPDIWDSAHAHLFNIAQWISSINIEQYKEPTLKNIQGLEWEIDNYEESGFGDTLRRP